MAKASSSGGGTASNPSARLWAITALGLAGAGISGILSAHYYKVQSGTAGFHSFCNIGEAINCDVVAASPYAELFAGLPLSSFGVGWFLSIAALALMARLPDWRREAIRGLLALTGFGTLLMVVYFGIMSLVIRTYCMYCLTTDAIILGAFALTLSLRPEGLKRAPLDGGKWKAMAGITGSLLLVSVVLLKGLDTNTGRRNISDHELVESVMSSSPVAVGSGPELPSIGPADAPVTIVEFSDFQCPFCRMGAFTLHTLQSRYPGKVRVVFRNFPLSSACNRKVQHNVHAVACDAARAVVCAHQQGKFEAAYEQIFEKQASLSNATIEKLATEGTGVDAARLAACMSSPEAAAAVSKDVEEGLALGVESTPTFFINGRKVLGVLPIQAWGILVERLAAEKK